MKQSSIWQEYNPGHLTRLINKSFSGDADATEEFLPLIYQELKMIAAHQRRVQGKPSDMLNTTAVVNEARIRLHEHGQGYSNRSHFLAVAAMAMRQLLIDEARKQMRKKRGDGFMRVTFSENLKVVEDQAAWLIALDQALDELGKYNPRLLNVFQLRFFAGLTEQEVAEALETSQPTVRRDWTKARAMLSVAI
jgi:RNA polymerase sigma factor (TIGR02999 family)